MDNTQYNNIIAELAAMDEKLEDLSGYLVDFGNKMRERELMGIASEDVFTTALNVEQLKQARCTCELQKFLVEVREVFNVFTIDDAAMRCDCSTRTVRRFEKSENDNNSLLLFYIRECGAYLKNGYAKRSLDELDGESCEMEQDEFKESIKAWNEYYSFETLNSLLFRN